MKTLSAKRVSIQPRATPLVGRLAATLPLAVLLLLVAAATALGYNLSRQQRIAADSEVRQLFFGFHAVERAEGYLFRWTDGASRLCLDQLGRVPLSIIGLRVLGAGANGLGNTTLTLAVNDRPVATIPLGETTRIHRVLVADALSRQDNTCIGLLSGSVASKSDRRLKGVPFVTITLAALPAGGPVWPAGLQLALNLALASVGYWLLRRLGAPGWLGALAVGGVAAALLGALAAGAFEAGWGLARHTLPLVAGSAVAIMAVTGGGALRARYAGAGCANRASVLGSDDRPRTTDDRPAPALRSSVVGRRSSQISSELPQGSTGLLTFDLVGMAFWSLALVGLTRLTQVLLGYSSVWPLKSGFYPQVTLLAVVVPALLFAGWLWLVLRSLAAPAARPWRDAGLVFVGALTLAVLLRGLGRGWPSLFATFDNNPYSYIVDVPRVGADPLGFLGIYNQIKGELALHSSTHPPGAILLLWAVARLLGPGPVPATLVTVVLSALAPLAGLWVGRRLGGPRLGLLAGALAAVMPGQLIYGATTMDGAFALPLAFGAAAFLLALEPPRRAGAAALAGLLIAVALLFTYATTQLFFFGSAALGLAVARAWGEAPGAGPARLWAAARPALRQGAIAAGVIVALYVALYLISGFNVLQGSITATEMNAQVMRGAGAPAFLPPSLSHYTLYLGANLLAYAWYLGPWGLTATFASGRAALVGRPLTAWSALAAALAALVAGMTLGGLFNREIERIWSFTYPLLAALMAPHILQGTPREQRWRAGLFLSLAFAHGMAFRLLLV
jgi:hypothetical protein